VLDADAVINNSSQKLGGSNAYPDPAPKTVGGSGPRKTHRISPPRHTAADEQWTSSAADSDDDDDGQLRVSADETRLNRLAEH